MGFCRTLSGINNGEKAMGTDMSLIHGYLANGASSIDRSNAGRRVRLESSTMDYLGLPIGSEGVIRHYRVTRALGRGAIQGHTVVDWVDGQRADLIANHDAWVML